MRFGALNERGERLLRILRPLIVGGEGEAVTADTAQEIALAITASDTFFPEEERSLQPSVFSPLRRLVADFAGVDWRGERPDVMSEPVYEKLVAKRGLMFNHRGQLVAYSLSNY